MKSSPNAARESSQSLKRVLGKADLVLLFVVAVANLNIVPAIASSGAMTLWLWVLALIVFFWPQGVAVTELSQKWPGEGGIYLWTKGSFGDHHAFVAGWCYWLANVFYLPTVLLSCIGAAIFMGGASLQRFAANPWFTGSIALLLLAILWMINVRGLSLSKWLNDLGGIGTIVGTFVLCLLSYLTIHHHESYLHLHDLNPLANGMNIHLLTAFGTICYSLIGLDLASVMGDEIRDPKRDLPSAVFWGGLLSGAIYLAGTSALLVALPTQQIGVLEGIMQGISSMATHANASFLVPIIALLLALAILGTASAWFAGAARLPFVAGLDHYLSPSLGKLHPRYGTPYISLNVFAILSGILVLASLIGGTVAEAFLILLTLASALLLISFSYMFASVLKRAFDPKQTLYANRTYLAINGLLGLTCTIVGMIVVFIPPAQVSSLWLYEMKLGLGTIAIFAAGYYFYRKPTVRAPIDAEIPAISKEMP